MNRLEVRSAVLECEGCNLNASSDGPVPFVGTGSSGVAVMGEAPSVSDVEAGKPFTGMAGELLRGLIKEAGFDPDSIFYMNTVSCLPVRASEHLPGRSRAPLQTEINACSTTRKMQLELADPKWLVLAGNVPLRIYRPHMNIGKVHGRVIFEGALRLFPIYNPVAGVRNPAWREDMRADLSLLARMVEQDDWTLGEPTCVTCGRLPEEGPAPWHWTDDGLPYCNMHIKRGAWNSDPSEPML